MSQLTGSESCTSPSLDVKSCPIATHSRSMSSWKPVMVRKCGSSIICVRLQITGVMSFEFSSAIGKVLISDYRQM